MPTIKDVAKRAGVSAMTVSRVLNDTSKVRTATRQKVERAIKELGYLPSGAAKTLRSKRSQTLALLVPDLANAFWTSLARGIEDAAREGGYSVLLCNTDEDTARQLHYLEVVISQQVDGVIVAPCDSDARNMDALRRREIPTVLVDRRITGWEVDTVIGDSISGARALTQHLINLGHRRIAMISGPVNTSTAADRVIGYQLALAEADIPYDDRLVRHGEYRSIAGERLAYELLDEGLAPTAVFAANNAIMIGALNALERRSLRVPQDVALVCFGDLPNASRFFPFLTIAELPSYEMGVNAAQLLLSRLEAGVTFEPRRVILPARLTIRRSCGSWLSTEKETLSLPIPSRELPGSRLVKPISPVEVDQLSKQFYGIDLSWLPRDQRLADDDKSDLNRLIRVLRHQEADRIPLLEFWVQSRGIYEYVLERELTASPAVRGPKQATFSVEDQVEFAQRLGIDAVLCDLAVTQRQNGYAANQRVNSWSDLARFEPPASLASQLNHIERYLRAAEGTGVGIVVGFPSFFKDAIHALGGDLRHFLKRDLELAEALMNTLLTYQERVMRTVCGRFGNDLAFLLILDQLGNEQGTLLAQDTLVGLYRDRMKQLIAPAKEHGLLVTLHSQGKIDPLLAVLHEIGIDAVHGLEPETNDIPGIRKEWAGRLALISNISSTLLAQGTPDAVEDRVREYCHRFAWGGGFVLGSAGKISDAVPPENFISMVRAARAHCRYKNLSATS